MKILRVHDCHREDQSSQTEWTNGWDIEQQAVINDLKGLDDSYLLVNNIKLRDITSKLNDIQLKNLIGDIDLIILGLNGIFVLETISYGGKIVCDGDEWSKRVMRWHLPIKNSPSRQVIRNSAILRNYLANNLEFIKTKENHFINSAIVLTKPNADLDAKNATVSIIRANELVNYIKSSNTENCFSAEELEMTAQSILKNCTQ